MAYWKRPGTDLDSTHRDTSHKVPSIQIQIWVVIIQSGRISSVEPLYLPLFMGMD